MWEGSKQFDKNAKFVPILNTFNIMNLFSLFIMGVFKNTGVVGMPPPLGVSSAFALYED